MHAACERSEQTRREWPPSRPRVSEGMRRPASTGRAQRLHRPDAPRCCGGAGGAPKPVVLADSPIGRRRRAQALDRAMRSGVSQITSTQKSSCWNGKANGSSVQSPMASLPNEPAPPNPRYERQHRRLLPTDVGDRGCPEPAAQAQRSGQQGSGYPRELDCQVTALCPWRPERKSSA